MSCRLRPAAHLFIFLARHSFSGGGFFIHLFTYQSSSVLSVSSVFLPKNSPGNTVTFTTGMKTRAPLVSLRLLMASGNMCKLIYQEAVWRNRGWKPSFRGWKCQFRGWMRWGSTKRLSWYYHDSTMILQVLAQRLRVFLISLRPIWPLYGSYMASDIKKGVYLFDIPLNIL